MDTDVMNRLKTLAGTIENETRGYRPLGSTVVMIDTALGDEVVTHVLGDVRIDPEEGDGFGPYSGELVIITLDRIAHVRLTRVQSVHGHGRSEGTVEITTAPRTAIRSVKLRADETSRSSGCMSPRGLRTSLSTSLDSTARSRCRSCVFVTQSVARLSTCSLRTCGPSRRPPRHPARCRGRGRR